MNLFFNLTANLVERGEYFNGRWWREHPESARVVAT